ncbi:MAG: hypothetical protein V1709_02790, partial [Planctomycetota bacterium]
GWVKTDNLNSGYANFTMDYWAYDIERNKYRSDVYNPLWWNHSKIVSGTATSWVKITMKVIVPLETTEIRIGGDFSGTKGKAYFDDITVNGVAVYDFENGVSMKRTVDDLFHNDEEPFRNK